MPISPSCKRFGLLRWKKEGVLAVYRPEGSDSIDQTFKDPDGHFTGVFVTAVSYAYNPQLVKADRRAEVGDGFPQAGIPRQDDLMLSA